jgi:CRP/FNR family transcriptional regulator
MNEKSVYEKEFISNFDFMQKLTEEERTHLIETASYRSIQAGAMMAIENESCMGIVFVLSGELKVFKVSESGREISLYVVKSGEACVLTVACFMSAGQYISPASIVATQNSVVAVVPCDAFRYHYATSPYLQQFIFKNTLEKFYDLIGLVERLTFKSVTERLWQHIIDFTAAGKKPLYTTHAQLAGKLGTSREVVTRRLHELEDMGLIRIERGKLILLKPDAEISHLRVSVSQNQL